MEIKKNEEEVAEFEEKMIIGTNEVGIIIYGRRRVR
jgi:hypothetical protein